MTSRRGFLASLAGAAATALDPERALWLPGKKLISVPAATHFLTSCDSITIRHVGQFDPKTGLYNWRIDQLVKCTTATAQDVADLHRYLQGVGRA